MNGFLTSAVDTDLILVEDFFVENTPKDSPYLAPYHTEKGVKM